MEKIPGIYVIADLDAAKAYVGSSTFCVRGRLIRHNREMRNGEHVNENLQDAYNKGHRLHAIPIPVEAGVNVRVLEQAVLDEFFPTGVLYNISDDVRHGGKEGWNQTEEAKAKISAARSGQPIHPNTIAASRALRLGVPRTEEEKEYLRNHPQAIEQARVVRINGVEYPSIKEANRQLGIPKATIRHRLQSNSEQFREWQDVSNT